jgi:hypothetical protein
MCMREKCAAQNVCVCVCVCVRGGDYVCICFMCVCLCMYVYVCIYVYMCMHVYECKHTRQVRMIKSQANACLFAVAVTDERAAQAQAAKVAERHAETCRLEESFTVDSK